MLQPQLTRLPYEVIEMIAEACVVTYGSDVMHGYGVYQLCFLGRLSRTCRQLAQDCAGALYRTVVIMDCTRAMKFLQALQNRPSLRAKVRTCTFRMEIMRDMDQTVNQLSEDLQQTFASETFDRSIIMEAVHTSDRRQLENTLIVLILQRIPCLRQLSTNWAALSLATRWPEESRLVGNMLSVLSIYFMDLGEFGPGCDANWFDWVSAFKPGHLPSEDLLLTLEAADFGCHCLHASECSYLYLDHEPTIYVREILASLRRLSLTECTDSMIETWFPLTQCPNIEQLTLGTTLDFPLEWMLRPLAALSHLKTTLKELRIHWTNTMDERESTSTSFDLFLTSGN